MTAPMKVNELATVGFATSPVAGAIRAATAEIGEGDGTNHVDAGCPSARQVAQRDSHSCGRLFSVGVSRIGAVHAVAAINAVVAVRAIAAVNAVAAINAVAALRTLRTLRTLNRIPGSER